MVMSNRILVRHKKSFPTYFYQFKVLKNFFIQLSLKNQIQNSDE